MSGPWQPPAGAGHPPVAAGPPTRTPPPPDQPFRAPSADPARPVQGRRTSWRIVLVHTATFRQARAFIPAILAMIAVGGSRLDVGAWGVVWLVIAVTAVSLAFALLNWSRFSYLDGDSAMVVTRGLLSRSVRTVPNDRVRGVEVETPPLHRVFGLVRVRIDAAAGAMAGNEEELVVDGLIPAEADRLRLRLLARRADDVPADAFEAEPVEEEFSRFDNRWLLYSPLVGSYLAVPLAGVAAMFRLADELPDRWAPQLGVPDVSLTLAVVVLVLVVVLLLVLGAVVGSVLVNWRFRLVRRGGSLVATRGLLTRRHTELEIDRIRGCTVTAGLGMRWVRAARASALVTGLGDATRRGQLLPLGPATEAWALAGRLVDDPGPLRSHPPAARQRRIVRAVLPGLVLLAVGLGVTLAFGQWWVLVVGGVLSVLGVPLGLGRYAALGHAAGPRSFSMRSGWLIREQVVLQDRAVVGWAVQQSFFQRRQGLATAVAAVGAGSGGYRALDMAADDVEPFTRAASGRWADTFARG